MNTYRVVRKMRGMGCDCTDHYTDFFDTKNTNIAEAISTILEDPNWSDYYESCIKADGSSAYIESEDGEDIITVVKV